MIDIEASRLIAETKVRRGRPDGRLDVILDPDGPLHVDDDYIVWAYNTKRAWAGDYLASLAGNGPVAIDRITGEVSFLTTSLPWEESLEELRGSRGA